MIEPGGSWALPGGSVSPYATAKDDADLAAHAYRQYSEQRASEPEVSPSERPIGVESGDVLRTLGIDGVRPAVQRMIYRFDLGLASIDEGEPQPFVAHMLVHNRSWSQEFVVAMNVGWCRDMYLGPRSHPNDSLLDITFGRLSLQQRLLARRRVRTGSHLPHPDLKVLRKAAWQVELKRKTAVHLDHVTAGSGQHIAVEIVGDAFAVIA